MNVDELRTALREPAPVPLEVCVDRVVVLGRRRRAVRRAAVPIVAVGTAAAIAVPALLLANRPAEVETARPGRATPTAGSSTPSATPTAGSPTPSPTAVDPTPTGAPPATPGAPGSVVDTGDRVAGGTRVFLLAPRSPGRYGLRMAVRGPAGALTTVYGVDPPLTAATPPGFRAVSFGGASAGDWVLFGVYRGPVDTVTAVVAGRRATARTGPLAGVPGLRVFWFSAGTGAAEPGDATDVRDLRAYDAGGHLLPAGDSRVGQG